MPILAGVLKGSAISWDWQQESVICLQLVLSKAEIQDLKSGFYDIFRLDAPYSQYKKLIFIKVWLQLIDNDWINKRIVMKNS